MLILGEEILHLKVHSETRRQLETERVLFSLPGNFQGLPCFGVTFLAFLIFMRLVAFSLFET